MQNYYTTISPLSDKCQTVEQSVKGNKRRSLQSLPQYHQPGLFDQQNTDLLPQIKRQKPQISSTPNVPPKDPNRYRVKLGDKILGDRLSIDEAVALAAKGGVK